MPELYLYRCFWWAQTSIFKRWFRDFSDGVMSRFSFLLIQLAAKIFCNTGIQTFTEHCSLKLVMLKSSDKTRPMLLFRPSFRHYLEVIRLEFKVSRWWNQKMFLSISTCDRLFLILTPIFGYRSTGDPIQPEIRQTAQGWWNHEVNCRRQLDLENIIIYKQNGEIIDTLTDSFTFGALDSASGLFNNYDAMVNIIYEESNDFSLPRNIELNISEFQMSIFMPRGKEIDITFPGELHNDFEDDHSLHFDQSFFNGCSNDDFPTIANINGAK